MTRSPAVLTPAEARCFAAREQASASWPGSRLKRNGAISRSGSAVASAAWRALLGDDFENAGFVTRKPPMFAMRSVVVRIDSVVGGGGAAPAG